MCSRHFLTLSILLNFLCVHTGAFADHVRKSLHHHAHLHTRTTASSAANLTANLTTLRTWWHTTGEINTQTPVQNENVRQSHLYSVQVAMNNASQEYYDSFVYETIPRNGNGQICDPTDLGSYCDVDDQITIEPDIGVTMAWTQFLYTSDVLVKVSRTNGSAISTNNIVLRPTTLNYTVTTTNDSAIIKVPYNPDGVRFSVEFQDDLWTYRNSGPGLDSYYVQNVQPGGVGYVPKYDNSTQIVGIEPRNALLIFASPFPTQDLIPNNANDTLYVPCGLVSGLDETSKSTVYFGPGVYYFTGESHALLSPSVNWVYFAPGSYVKGAVEYQSLALGLRATGFGILSGEQYVYQANVDDNYQNVKSDTSSLHMFSSTTSAAGMTWTLHGVTINAPPFNSMDFSGPLDNIMIHASDYKQVGAFFGQTDGLEMYPNSYVHDVFYHSGDDVIKTYYSNVRVERIIVWKTNNAPIIQFGWYPRNLTNVTVDTIDVIHSRYISQDREFPRALIGSAASYENSSSTSTADTTSRLSNYTVSNVRSEGISPGLLGINPLQDIDTMVINNVWIEELAPQATLVDTSTFRLFTDSEVNQPIQLGQRSPNNTGLTINAYYVGDTHVTFTAGNWNSSSLGRLDINTSFQGKWTVV